MAEESLRSHVRAGVAPLSLSELAAAAGPSCLSPDVALDEEGVPVIL